MGDLVRITANDPSRGLVNGDLGRVMALDNTHDVGLQLPDGREVWLDGTRPLLLDYGYCSTVHAAQGQTCSRVLIDADAHSLTASRNSFYVAISRARDSAHIYTDDREMLPAAMSREHERQAALEMVADLQPERQNDGSRRKPRFASQAKRLRRSCMA
ncbi:MULTISPECIES: ATP-dependent RecD-like DNA helicase [unclassified Simplicispira]|uniref:ATP-dependent DNA helicase n=1 Tax=unclassified Simplicispira TaxID=2630407 RepID=UPI001314B187|nr:MULTISPECIES: ATP-dependent RecD-like DNA helicase [unclassified Simplicispira]